ncbi:ORF30 [black bullhead herpesvirus]|uniref:ORF30 n=1 Tax=black bullhead herpesvirus TaxID=508441 RepID=A0A2H5AJG9_9VIRU|nr:ORF30 [black bullhead herpesvirus]AUG72284.1 ORF30 [black bullhead herpesvirus]
MDVFNSVSESINILNNGNALRDTVSGDAPPSPSHGHGDSDKPWGVNFSGHDFLVNAGARPDVITGVEQVDTTGSCPICASRSDNGTSLATAMEPMVASRQIDSAMSFLAMVRPDLADWNIINLHFSHGIKDPIEKMEYQLDTLIDVHYRAGMAIGRDFAMYVTANGSQFVSPNEKNIKCLNSLTTGLTKLIQTRGDLRKGAKKPRAGM